jgi:hypothetical protein
MTFYDPNSIAWSTVGTRVGVVGGAGTPVLQYLEDRKVGVRSFPNLSTAKAAFQTGQIDAILLIPEDTPGPVTMELMLPKSEVERTVITVMLDEPLKRFENKTIYTLISTPISASQVFAAKVSAAVAAAIVQVIICTALLSWNGIVINRLSLVLILTLSYIVSISFGGAIIATFFKDRQRSQFIYSLIIIVAGSVSCFLKPSPLELLTKLSAGAPNVSLIGFVIYIALAIAVGLIFFCLSERLMTAKG